MTDPTARFRQLDSEPDERDADPPMSFLDVLAPPYRAMLRGVREP